LIAEHIHSVEQLEVLLLMRRTRERDWSADEVARELATSPGSAAFRLEDLAAHGFAVTPVDGRYRYGVEEPGRDRALGELADAFGRRRRRVISLIFSKPSDNIRTFADAFRLRKED
jgi:predicted ArsR family transcriptional regulator